VTFSAISATRLAILAAMTSKGDTPCIPLGTGGVFFAAAAVAVSVPLGRSRLVVGGREDVWLARAAILKI
jgi:hypothetical protein